MGASPVIRITVDGEDQYARAFSRLDAVFDDLTPIWPDVRDEFWRIETEQFDSQGGKGKSGSWQPLEPGYKVQKINRYGAGKKILEATGALRGSLTGPGQGSVYSASKRDMEVGTTIPYGVFHYRGPGNLPSRPPISLSDTQQRSMNKVIQTSLVKELRTGKYYVPVVDR